MIASDDKGVLNETVNQNSWLKGHCYCGCIGYEVSSTCQPHRALYCHCESCRRAHASPLYHVVYVKPQDIRILQGEEENLKMYTKTGSSVTRSFCTTCGSRMFNYLARDSDWVGFFPATLEEDLQKDLPIAFRATAHHLGEEAVLDISQLVLHVPEG